MSISIEPIGVIHSCFKQKFGIPRQAGLVPEAHAYLQMHPPYDHENFIRGLDGFSHVWIIFLFHRCERDGLKSTVRPPRLGGNRRLGVFATRSGFRPNPIGMSAVELKKIIKKDGCLRLYLRGADILDGSPVLDIKPYIPYADAHPAAEGGFAAEPPGEGLRVEFSPEADRACRAAEADGKDSLRKLIIRMLQYDPRPAYYDRNSGKKQFATRIDDVDIHWKIDGTRVIVTTILPVVSRQMDSKTQNDLKL